VEREQALDADRAGRRQRRCDDAENKRRCCGVFGSEAPSPLVARAVSAVCSVLCSTQSPTKTTPVRRSRRYDTLQQSRRLIHPLCVRLRAVLQPPLRVVRARLTLLLLRPRGRWAVARMPWRATLSYDRFHVRRLGLTLIVRTPGGPPRRDPALSDSHSTWSWRVFLCALAIHALRSLLSSSYLSRSVRLRSTLVTFTARCWNSSRQTHPPSFGLSIVSRAGKNADVGGHGSEV
jgi:hypothetical protein